MRTFILYTTSILITICLLDFMLFFWLSEISTGILLISFGVMILALICKDEFTN